jgi:hypothetical protein
MTPRARHPVLLRYALIALAFGVTIPTALAVRVDRVFERIGE